MIDSTILRTIIDCDTDSLRVLASVAGGHPASFFRGANFDDADLRGQDLRGFNLQAATFKRARIDRNTKVDPQFEDTVGLHSRVSLDAYVNGEVINFLKKSHIGFNDRESSKILGDIIESVIFENKLHNIKVTEFREFMSYIVLRDFDVEYSVNINYKNNMRTKNTKESIIKRVINTTNYIDSNAYGARELREWLPVHPPSKTTRRKISIASHIYPSVERISAKFGMPKSSFCNLLLRIHVSHLLYGNKKRK